MPLTCLIFLPFMQVSRSTVKVSLTFNTCDLFIGHMSRWSMVRTLDRLWLCHGLYVFFFMSMQRTFMYREFHPALFPPKVLLYNVFLFSILAVPRFLYPVTCPDLVNLSISFTLVDALMYNLFLNFFLEITSTLTQRWTNVVNSTQYSQRTLNVETTL